MNQSAELKLSQVHQENIKPVSAVTGTAGSTSHVTFSVVVPPTYPQSVPVDQYAKK